MLLSLLAWRCRLYPEDDFPAFGRKGADQFALEMGNALETLLLPWLEDEKTINHGVLAQILKWGNEGLPVKPVRKPRASRPWSAAKKKDGRTKKAKRKT